MTRAIRFRSAMVATAALASVGAQAAIVDILASKDNSIYSESGSLSNATGPGIIVGRTATGNLRRGLIAFDIASVVPVGATINSVSLKLYMSQTNIALSNVSVHRLLQDWGQGTSFSSPGGAGAAATPGDPTWVNNFYNTSTWTTAGGTFAAVASATSSGPELAFTTWSSASLAADVQSMLNTPGQNFGWILVGDEAVNGSAIRYGSKENTDPAKRPILSVTYTPVPEPATMAVLAFGALGLLRRRQK
jgi:hypothetical protein